MRLSDNHGLCHALNGGNLVLPIFIFDENILGDLPKEDARVTFIHQRLAHLNKQLSKYNCSIYSIYGNPLKVWQNLITKFNIDKVYMNKDYDPYSIDRDQQVERFLIKHNIAFQSFKDVVIFEEREILKSNNQPYSVFTPYKRAWLKRFEKEGFKTLKPANFKKLLKFDSELPTLQSIGFAKSSVKVKDFSIDHLDEYESLRNFPARNGTSYLGPHLRFGTVGIRELISRLKSNHAVFLSELIWREFFMQILFHYPRVINQSFREKYDRISWRNNEDEFEKWTQGMTGYPMVDAGMRQLNETGYMHNRIRMVTASFLCKNLLIDWRWGEAYFAQKLLDYELSSNNGNWQWAAGTGCDAAPYFRVFNPTIQMDKFDKRAEYIKRWVPEYGTENYVQQIIEHSEARKRAISTYKEALS